MTQRYATNLNVFDTYKGLSGLIIQMDLSLTSPLANPLAPAYTGSWFVVQFTDATLQLFTDQGQRVDHSTGIPTVGVTLLTLSEYNAAATAGYPV
jgi:hypothetical protein